jgi:hypothetical protein
VVAQHAIDLDIVDVAVVCDDVDVDLGIARVERLDFRPQRAATGIDGELAFGCRGRIEVLDLLRFAGDGGKNERRCKAESYGTLAINDSTSF